MTNDKGALPPPNWDLWANMQTVQLWQAVALSMPMDPEAVKWSRHAWMAGTSYLHVDWQETFSKPEDARRFQDRYTLLESCFRHPPFTDPLEASLRHRSPVKLLEFVSWANSQKLFEPLPEPLKAVLDLPTDASAARVGYDAQRQRMAAARRTRPNWEGKWNHVPKLPLWKAACLSCDEPPESHESVILETLKLPRGPMQDRLEVLQANLSTEGPIRPAGDITIGVLLDPLARLVLVPDVGKEASADGIARDVGAAVAAMPEGWADNSDVNDLAQQGGFDAVEALLSKASEPAKAEPRYRLLTGEQLSQLPPLAWRVRGVLPAVGVAALYGPSASGKSFLAFDMACAIAEGHRWFDCRVKAAPVVYAALEGEAGFKLRAQAWEKNRGRSLPAGLKMVLQAFRLTEREDVRDFAAVLPAGAVVFLDTLNRAAPTVDENSSRDMGEILEAAKLLQELTAGLVVLIHHTGKDTTRGLRGHSSLFAAMDAAVEVSRDGDRREWRVGKSKDGADGDAHPFKLSVEVLAADEHGDPITSCVVVPDTAASDVRAVKLPQGGNQRIVLNALRPLLKDGQLGSAGAPPMARCVELEAAVTSAAAALPVPADRKAERARDAITGLIARGVLGCAEGWLWQA